MNNRLYRGEIVINKIDGQLLAQMMISGANNLYNNKKIVDDLNVFPVPDGDTGTNMSMTMMAMSKTLTELRSTSVTKVADAMSFSTLRGARGNSGVILSQLFRGISKKLKGLPECTSMEIAQALKEGVDTAYRAVMNPTEGTILTVSKEVAIGAVLEANINEDVTKMIEKAVDRGNKSLAKTQDMLPALKQAGVVDAGGQGWMFILEGALYFLKNNDVVALNQKIDDEKEKASKIVDTQRVGSVENIKYTYCTEFIIEKKNANANVIAFRQSIETKGDSMLVIDDDDIVKVHIHTNNPGYVLERAAKLGMMINIKIDNMKHQSQNLIDEEASQKEIVLQPHKKYAFVSVCAGDGIANILKDLGVDNVIEGGQTMNPSTEDILNSVATLNADTIYVFPNNKNIILAANQAKEITDKNIIVIPTKSIPQCVSAMLEFNQDKDEKANEKSMIKVIDNVKTGQVTYAVRDTMVGDTVIKEGDILGINGSKIVQTGSDYNSVCANLISDIVDDDNEFITVYYGIDVTLEQVVELEKLLEELYPDMEVSMKYGGQPLYYYIVSVE